MNFYRGLVNDYVRLLEQGRKAHLGGLNPLPKPLLDAQAPAVLIFSPHPDDECIIGGLPVRLLREAKMRVSNVAVTQGSKKDRQAERWLELRAACDFIGYELIQTGPTGLENVNVIAREKDGEAWAKSVVVIREIIQRTGPRIVFFPHEHDWNSTHIGTHLLVTDALAALPEFNGYTVETEYWGQNNRPNLMVESSAQDAADLVAGTSFHVGEVTRNPFHLFIPAWMQDNVRRGSELVGGQGKGAPDWTFATLYRLRRWHHGGFEEAMNGGRLLSAQENPAALFPTV